MADESANLIDGPDPRSELWGSSASLNHVDNEGFSADVSFEADIYDQVVVAAFGGVQVQLDQDEKAIVHPIWLFAICIPLWLAQGSALMWLRLDMDPMAPVNREGELTNLIKLKMLMVVVVQLMLFSELLGTIRLFVFTVNPRTWVEIRRTDPNEFKKFRCSWIYRFHCVFPFALLAMVMKFSVCYCVAVDSVSVILESEHVKDTIFNCLAITFIADLDEKVWTLCQSSFSVFTLEDFEFEIWDERKIAEVAGRFKRWNCFRSLGCLGRSQQSGRNWESLVTFLILTAVYIRQIFIILLATDTNVLPVTRDLCSIKRWISGDLGRFPMSVGLFRVWESFLIGDPGDLVAHIIPHNVSCAVHGKYGRMGMMNFGDIMREYPWLVFVAVLSVSALVVLPQISLWVMRGFFTHCFYLGHQRTDQATAQPGLGNEQGKNPTKRYKRKQQEVLQTTVDNLLQDYDKMRQRLAMLEKKAG